MIRPPQSAALRRLLLLPLLGLLLLALGAVAWLDNAANRGITYTPELPPIPWTGGQPIGVNAYNIQFEPDRANVTRTLELTRAMGARYVRVQMPWEDVEIHAKGDFEDRRNDPARSAWEKYDFIFGEMARLGLEPIVRIDRPPAWARVTSSATPEFQAGYAANPTSTGPPDDPADYAEFVGAVAARYQDQVRFIQIWNEPNLAYEWNWQTPQPEQFVELLRLAYDAARAANPEAVILFPSLAPTDGLDPTAPLSDLEYLDRVYRAGGADFFDIMSAQAYGLGQPPEEHRYVRLRESWMWRRPLDTRIDVSRLPLLREVMERHGDHGTAVWVSEFGYNTAPEGSIWGAPVTEEQRAEYLVGQIERARHEWPWVGVMNVWILRWGGEPPNPADPTPYFAIVERDFAPLPAYDRLKQYLAQPPVAGVGAHAWDHPAVSRAGDGAWELRFEGQSLALSGSGAATVTIDGGAPVQVNLADDATAVASGLPDTAHTARVEARGAPAAFLVGRQPPAPWLWALAPALLLVALAAVGARAA